MWLNNPPSIFECVPLGASYWQGTSNVYVQYKHLVLKLCQNIKQCRNVADQTIYMSKCIRLVQFANYLTI